MTAKRTLALWAVLSSVFDALFRRPWPVEDPDGVVAVPPASHAGWRDWAERATAFSGLVARGTSGRDAAKDRRLSCQLVSAFQARCVGSRSGRSFGAGEHGVGRAALVSHRSWQEQLGAGPAALGETIALEGLRSGIAGLAAPRFDGLGGRVDVCRPFATWTRLTASDVAPEQPSVCVAGWLAPGMPAERAQAELATASAGFRREHGLDQGRRSP